MRASVILLALTASLSAETALVVTADQTDWALAAGGTIAKLAADGVEVHLVRVGNDEKDSWDLSPEETAVRARKECEEAARILGVKQVHSLGYRSGELVGVQHTELRDRILFFIRKYKPRTLFLPNPYAEYVEALDRFHVGKAAEDAWRSGPLENVQPAFASAGLEGHVIDEVYYYAQPVDPRRREPESTATFVPQPKALDIAATIEKRFARRRPWKQPTIPWRGASNNASMRPGGGCRCSTKSTAQPSTSSSPFRCASSPALPPRARSTSRRRSFTMPASNFRFRPSTSSRAFALAVLCSAPLLMNAAEHEFPKDYPPTNEIRIDNRVAVPMRDGVVLFADVFRPVKEGKYPVIVSRTPYSTERAPNAYEAAIVY